MFPLSRGQRYDTSEAAEQNNDSQNQFMDRIFTLKNRKEISIKTGITDIFLKKNKTKLHHIQIIIYNKVSTYTTVKQMNAYWL